MPALDSAEMRARLGGFGLIELVVAIAIVAILTATALPSMREMARRMTVTGTTNDLVGALATARAEAAKRGAWVAVIGPGSNWSSGWHVEADAATPPDAPNREFGDSTDVLVAEYAAVDSGYAVKAKVTNGNGGDTRIVFGPAGNLVDGAAGTVITADINVCRPDNNAGESRWIHVQSSGEIVSQRDTGSSPAPACN
jgi:prepilin-type N-terminal cleavage/methylation domain-containing protein